VTVALTGSVNPQSVVTGSDGSYSIPAAVGENTVSVTAQGNDAQLGAAMIALGLPPAFSFSSSFSLSEATVTDLVLPSTVMVTALVVDTAGHPVDNADVGAYMRNNQVAPLVSLPGATGDVNSLQSGVGYGVGDPVTTGPDGIARFVTFAGISGPDGFTAFAVEGDRNGQTSILDHSTDTSVTITLPRYATPPLDEQVTVAATQAVVTWSPPTDSGDGQITGYQVDADPVVGNALDRVVAAGAAVAGTISVTVPADARSATLTGLHPGVTYNISVRAITPVGLGAPATVIAVTLSGPAC
jgi:hypothetical protein